MEKKGYNQYNDKLEFDFEDNSQKIDQINNPDFDFTSNPEEKTEEPFDILNTIQPGMLVTPKTAKTKAEIQLAMEAEMAIENKDQLF